MQRRSNRSNQGFRNPRNRSRGRGAGKKSTGQLAPPEFIPTFSIGHKFRFTSGAVGFTSLPITRAMLLNLYTMATTTTQQDRIITAIKLKRIRMWTEPGALGGTAATNVVEWKGLNAPSTIHSDTSMGVRPAFIDSRPPVDASNRWWSISGMNETEVLVNLAGANPTIIDIDCSVRFADDEAAVGGENGTGAASTIGKVYWNYLDGFTSKLLAPVGGVTILP